MQTPNYYDILGVSRDATHSDIKKAYRNLARTHHPDVSDESSGFSDITKAYSVIGDPSKRKEYDLSQSIQNTENISPFFDPFFKTQTAPVLKVNMGINVQNAVLGAELNARIRIPANREPAPSCHWCAGTGQRMDNSSGFPSIEKCDCGKEQMEDVEIGVRVPRGARTGDTITIEEPEGTPYRKIVITLAVEDPRYDYSNNQTTYTLTVNTLDLITGTKKRIPFFDRWVYLTIPQGTNPGERFEISSEHYPDVKIYVVLDAVTPDIDNRKTREDLAKLIEVIKTRENQENDPQAKGFKD